MKFPRKRVSRLFRILGLALLVCILLLGALVLFIQTPPGKRILASAASGMLSRLTEATWVIEGIHGIIPFDVSIDRVAWSDMNGQLLTIDKTRVVPHLASLLGGIIHFSEVSAERIHIERFPKGQEKSDPPNPDVFARLPETLSTYRIDRLAVGRLQLAETAFGTGAAFVIEGAWQTTSDLGTKVSFVNVDGLEDTETQIDVRIEEKPERDGTALRVDAVDESFLPAHLPWPGSERVEVSIKNEGQEQSGEMAVSLNDQAVLEGKLGLRTKGAPRLRWNGKLFLDHPLLPSSYAKAGGQRPEVSLEVEWPESGRVVLETLDVSSEALSAHIECFYDMEKRTLGTQLACSYENLSRIMEVPEGFYAGPWHVNVDVEGPLSNVNGVAEIAAKGETVLDGKWSAAFSPNLMLLAELEMHPRHGVLPPKLQDLGTATASLEIKQDDGGVLHFPGVMIKANGAEVELSGSFSPQGKSLNLSSSLRVVNLAAFQELAPAVRAGDVAASAELQASKETMNFTAELDAQEVQLESGITVADTHLQADAKGDSWWNDSGMNFQLISEGRTRIDVQDSYANEVTYTLDAAMLSSEKIVLNALKATDGAVSLSGSGTYDLESKKGQAEATVTIPDISLLPETITQGFGGRIRLGADITTSLESLSTSLQVDATQLSGLPPATLTALGNAAHARATAEKTGTRIEWNLARLEAGPLTLEGQGTYLLDEGELNASADFVYNDLSNVGPLAGMPMRGGLSGTADFSLQQKALNLRVDTATRNMAIADWEPDAVRLAATVSGPLDAPEGTISGDAMAYGESMQTDVAWSYAGSVLGVSKGVVAIGENRVAFQGDYDLRSRQGSGEIEAELPVLASVGQFARLSLEGAASASAQFEAGPNDLDAIAEASTQSLATPWFSAEKTNLSGDMRGNWTSPAGEVHVALTGVNAGSVALEEASIDLQGDGDSLAIETSINGNWTDQFPFEARAAAAIEDNATLITLRDFDGEVDEYVFSAPEPALLALTDGVWSLSGLSLVMNDSRLTANGTYSHEEVDAEAAWEHVPLALVSLAGGSRFAGTTSGSVTLRGTPDLPVVKATGEVSGLRVGKRLQEDAPAVNATFNALIEQGHSRLQLAADAGELLQAEGEGRVPLQFSLAPWNLELLGQETIDGSFQVSGNLKAAELIMPLEGHLLEGPLEARLEISGNLDNPQLEGQAVVTGGRYENLETITILEDIQAEVQANDTMLRLASFRANTVPEGTIETTGEWDLAAESGLPFSAEATFDKARLVNRDDLSAEVNGDVSLAGDTDGIRVNGDVSLGRSVLRLPRRLPARVTTIPVEEENAPETLQDHEEHSKAPIPVELDIKCLVPGRFYVTGNGLDSEWEGELDVKGTAQKPELRGNLRVRRGELQFLNRRLELKDSTIAFDGSTPISPYFNLWGTTETRDLTSRVHIYGNMNSVELDLESQPSLPEDQVLARLLFDRDIKQLSPIQAIQLARFAGALSGGEFGLSGLPTGGALPFVDRVQLQTGDEPSETALGVGKYLGERTYVEIKKGLGAEGGKVSVEMELTPEVSIEGEAGSDAHNSLGLFWKKDY